MDPYKETFETWNKIAQIYQDKFMDLDLYNATYDEFCRQLTKTHARILEIGCGPGNITRYMLTKREDLLLEGIDIAPNMVKLAKQNNPRAGFKVMDSRNIESLDGPYDAILCGFCLPYLSEADALKLIRDSYRLLSEQGLIYLSFVTGNPAGSGYHTGSSGDRTFFYYHDRDTLRTNLESNAFYVTYENDISYTKNDNSKELHTVLIAKKQ